MRRALKSWAPAYAALVALILLVYGPLFFAPVIGDDLRFVQDNPLFSRPFGEVLSAAFSTRYFLASGEATYQPLVTLLHYFTHGAPAANRLIGLLLHALNGLLLWALARRVGASSKAALAAALAFSVFPANTETLAMSGFKGHVLAFGAAQGALLCWSAMLDAPEPALYLIGAAACLLFGFLCKETALVALPLCAAYSLCFARGKRRDWQLLGVGALAVLAGLYLFWRFALLEPPSYAARPMPGPLALLGWYVKTLILPYPLCRERIWTYDTVWDVLGGAYFVLLWLLRRRPRPLFAALWIGACCLPFLRLVPFASDNPVADRYVYGASAGFALLLATAFAQSRAALALYALTAVWGCEALSRDALYTDRRGLCEQTVACAPDSPRAHVALAQDMIFKNDFTEGKAEALKALSLDASSSPAYNLLGIADFNLGDIDGAQDALDHAVVFDPASPDARLNIGDVLLKLGFEDEALENFEMAARLRPGWDAPRLAALELRRKIAAEPKTRVPRRRRRALRYR